MSDVLLEDKIQEFWKWFVLNEAIIVEAINASKDQDHSELTGQLDNQILNFGTFAWEIGFGQSKPYFLTISPNNSSKFLAISKSIMKAAPSLKSWEFNAAKIPVDWDLNFKIYDAEFDAHKVDASGWQQVLKKNLDQSINIILLAKSISHLDLDTQMRAADMVVTSLIGEELRINAIQEIEVVNNYESNMDEIRSAPIQILLKQIQGYQEL